MQDQNKIERIRNLMDKWSIGTDIDSFKEAFNMSPRTNKVSNSTKGNRKNSKLATIGDAVIELFVREELASNDDSSAEISWEKQRYVSNEDLKARAIALGLDKLEIFELNSQQSEDYASLLEAIVGWMFLNNHYKKCSQVLRDFIFKDMKLY